MNKKYLLLASQNSTLNKKELEAQALPYTFTSNGHRIRNYRIYGAEDGVGDLDNDTGKYVIPVTIGETYTNIYLPYPLYQIDGSADYIDFRNQKQYLKNRFIELSSSHSLNSSTVEAVEDDILMYKYTIAIPFDTLIPSVFVFAILEICR